MTEATRARSYVACEFRAEDWKTYTYHWDGAPLVVGGTVRVEDRDGDGWKKVIVASASDQKPSFPTKPILCLHVEEAAALDAAE